MRIYLMIYFASSARFDRWSCSSLLSSYPLFSTIMSRWGGMHPPQILPLDSSHQQLSNDLSFTLVTLADVTQRLSQVLATVTSSSSPASFSTFQHLLLQSITNISTITHHISLSQQQQSRDIATASCSPSLRAPSSAPLHTIRILTGILALTPSSSCLPLSVTDVGYPGDDVSAPKSSSCQNSFAAIVSSSKS